MAYHIKIRHSDGGVVSYCNRESLDPTTEVKLGLLRCTCEQGDWDKGMILCAVVRKLTGLDTFLYPTGCDERDRD